MSMVYSLFHTRDNSPVAEFQGRSTRSISFNEDSPEVFEFSTRVIINPDHSCQDSITPKFSEFTTFSNFLQDVSNNHARQYSKSLTVERNSIESQRKNIIVEQSEINEFFCVTTEQPKTLTAACGCALF